MKKLTFSVVFTAIILLLTTLSTQAVEVTFRVDMQDQTVPATGVHLAGGFSEPLPWWDPTGIALDEPFIGTIWEVTLTLTEGEVIEYKFVNGNEWGQDESVSGPCSPGNGNRIYTVPASDTTLPAVCFGFCTACVLPQVDITFKVDMTNETVSPNGIHIAGSFQGWDPAANELTLVGDNIYQVTLPLGVGEYITYKFINGDAWGTPGAAQEIVPSDCGVDDWNGGYNRYLTVPATNTPLEAVCFGSCVPCAGTNFSDVTFVVDMTNEIIPVEGVHIAGSFNGWNASSDIMTDNGDGTWEYTGNFQEGISIEYKFINGDTWEQDETVPPVCAQNGNRFLTIPLDNTTLPSVCFGKCNDCNPTLYNVTFRVDMAEQTVAPEGVHLTGSFQGWDTTATMMSNTINDIYEVTIQIGEGDYHEFKYLNGNTWAAAEFVPGECSWFGNRTLIGPAANSDLDVVCFGYCTECLNTVYTFNLQVYLEGPFNGTAMNTTLYDNGILSTSQPFNMEPWNYDGTEMISAPLDADIVDWVLVEFRQTDGDASTATPDKFLDRQAALVLADGSIVGMDGSSSIIYTGNITQNLFVIIHQRNHLSVMSANALPEVFGNFGYNFTFNLSQAYLNGQKAIGGGMYGMIGGDSDANGTVDTDDKDLNWNIEAGETGYFQSDLNLDGQINNPDKNDVWEINLNSSTTIPN
jgi:hypothetical protein